MFIETNFEFNGVLIHEPIAMITDLMVSACCYYAFVKTKNDATQKSIFFFKYFFLLMGLATTYGGIIGHGFINYLSFNWKIPGWIISMFAVMFIERAAITHSSSLMKSFVGKIFSIANIIEMIILLTIVLSTANFFYVEAHASYGIMVVVFSLELFVYIKTKSKGAGLILIGIGFIFISAIVHLAVLSPHKWFNHIDLSHTLMAISTWFIFSGSQKLYQSGFTASKI